MTLEQSADPAGCAITKSAQQPQHRRRRPAGYTLQQPLQKHLIDFRRDSRALHSNAHGLEFALQRACVLTPGYRRAEVAMPFVLPRLCRPWAESDKFWTEVPVPLIFDTFTQCPHRVTFLKFATRLASQSTRWTRLKAIILVRNSFCHKPAAFLLLRCP